MDISIEAGQAKVLGVKVIESKKEARVSVPADQLSLAIGKQGQNVRLAAKLTGWKIDVVSGEPSSDEATKSKDKKEGKVEEKSAEEVVAKDKPAEKKKKTAKKKEKSDKESKHEKEEESEDKKVEEKSDTSKKE